jgi:subtilisin family serine protease
MLKKLPVRLVFALSYLSFGLVTLTQAQTIHPDYRDGQLYVLIRSGFAASKAQPVSIEAWVASQPDWQALAKEFRFTKVKRASVLDDDPIMSRYLKLDFEAHTQISDLVTRLKALHYVEDAEPVELLYKTYTPNDLNTNQWALPLIRAREAWSLSRGSSQVVVAVIDDAVMTTHLDLAPNIWVNPGEIPGNGRDDDGNGFVDDINGYDVADRDPNPNPPARATAFEFSHGTHCAGIVSAATDNSRGIASIGFSVRIMAVKCKPDGESGPSIPNGYEGVDYAIKAGANILSLSWGGTGSSNFAQNLLNTAWRRGIVVVAAAGNDNVNRQFFPAAYQNVIAVGATDQNDRKARFSNFGAYIDVMAPGVQILSTVPGNPANNHYEFQSGTSMACPLVAGLLGLLKSYNSDLTADQLRDCLIRSCVPLDGLNPQYRGLLGAGRIDAFAALQCVGPPSFEYDLAVRQVLQPGNYTCETAVLPIVDVFNSGTQPIRSFQLSFRYDESSWESITWNGLLNPENSALVELPNWLVSSGTRVLRLRVSAPDGQEDQNSLNDTLIFMLRVNHRVLSLPFSEDFESFGNPDPNLRNPNGWYAENPDNDLTWGIFQINGNGPGRRSAGILLYRYTSQGQRDGLVTPPIDLTGFDNLRLSFKHSYRRFSQDIRDSIIVYLSNDCGESFRRVFSGGGGPGFATGSILNGREFIPQDFRDWCGTANGQLQPCFEIDLADWEGQQVMVKFESFNANGNNIFLDDINLSGRRIAVEPRLRIEPTRFRICSGDTVRFLNRSIHVGNTKLSWVIDEGVVLDSSRNHLTVRFSNPGSYTVGLAFTNAQGEQVVQRSPSVEVSDGPPIVFSSNPFGLCQGRSDTLVVSPAQSYNWSPSTGVVRVGSNQFVFKSESEVVYQLNATYADGCSSTAQLTVRPVRLEADWQVAVRESDTQVNLDLNRRNQLGSSHLWELFFNNELEFSSTDFTTSFPIQKEGSWTVRLTLNELNCQAMRDTVLDLRLPKPSTRTQSAVRRVVLRPNPVLAGTYLTLDLTDQLAGAWRSNLAWINALGQTSPVQVVNEYNGQLLIRVPQHANGLLWLRLETIQGNLIQPVLVVNP